MTKLFGKSLRALTLLNLAACGGIVPGAGEDKTSSDFGRIDLPPVKGPDIGQNPLPVTPINEPLPTTMCSYWDSLPLAATDAESFQIIDSLAVQKAGNVQRIVGRHVLSRLPQVRYALSMDGRGSVELEDPYPECPRYPLSGPTPLDPPDLVTFKKLAERENQCGRLSNLEWSGLKLLYNLGMKTEILKLRDSKFKEAVEVQLPGVFTGVPGPIKDSPLMIEFHASAGLPREPDTAKLATYRIFSRKVKLFTSNDFATRRADAYATLGLLQQFSGRTDLPLSEVACRFALGHRFTAQMLSMKGIIDAPKVKTTGLLEDFPSVDVTPFPKRSEGGIFGEARDEAWILAQVDRPTVRPTSTETTSGLLQGMRYFAELAAHRENSMWRLQDDDGKIQNAPTGEYRMDPKLLKLSFGLFGIAARYMQNEELTVTADQSLILRDDTADNLAELGLASIQIPDAFGSLTAPNEIELQVLSDAQIEEFTKPYPDGVVPQFEMLRTGFALEGLARLREGRGSEKLKAALRTLGDRIGNEGLRNLP